MSALIELDNVTYTYRVPGAEPNPALRELSLRIEAGEYVAILGANGSGKSTLARHLNALLLPERGHVRVMGLDTRDTAAHREIRRTVGMVFQHPDDQIVATLVEEDVAFGPENLGLSPDQIRMRVQEALTTVGLWEERDRPPHLLSAGQMQRLAIAGVIALSPRCVVFDEATAMLDPRGRDEVRALMAHLHRQGVTVIAITHFMEEAVEAERVIILSQGRVVRDAPPAVVFTDVAALQELGLDLPPVTELAATLQTAFPALPNGLLTVPALVEALDRLPHPTGRVPSAAVSGQRAVLESPLVSVEDLQHTYMEGTPLEHEALAGVSLSVTAGGVHGLAGATGSGKSTLMQHLNGLLRPQKGRVCVGKFDLSDPNVDVTAVRRMVGLAFQIPELQIFEQYVGDEIAYGPRLSGMKGADLRERVRWAMELVGLGFEAYKDRLTFALSGGEQRKVALASVLALRPEILLLDEPTAGLDPRSHREVLAHLQSLGSTGMTLVLSSHRMEDLALLAGHLTILADGRDVMAGLPEVVFAKGERLRELGLGLPVVPQVAASLRARGWPLPAGLISSETLRDALQGLVIDG